MADCGEPRAGTKQPDEWCWSWHPTSQQRNKDPVETVRWLKVDNVLQKKTRLTPECVGQLAEALRLREAARGGRRGPGAQRKRKKRGKGRREKLVLRSRSRAGSRAEEEREGSPESRSIHGPATHDPRPDGGRGASDQESRADWEVADEEDSSAQSPASDKGRTDGLVEEASPRRSPADGQECKSDGEKSGSSVSGRSGLTDDASAAGIAKPEEGNADAESGALARLGPRRSVRQRSPDDRDSPSPRPVYAKATEEILGWAGRGVKIDAAAGVVASAEASPQGAAFMVNK